jgi:hypothetical protein
MHRRLVLVLVLAACGEPLPPPAGLVDAAGRDASARGDGGTIIVGPDAGHAEDGGVNVVDAASVASDASVADDASVAGDARSDDATLPSADVGGAFEDAFL